MTRCPICLKADITGSHDFMCVPCGEDLLRETGPGWSPPSDLLRWAARRARSTAALDDLAAAPPLVKRANGDERKRILHALARIEAIVRAARISVEMASDSALPIGLDGPQALVLAASEVITYVAAHDAVLMAIVEP